MPWAMAALFRQTFDETSEQCLIVSGSQEQSQGE
jgi:hypothetical protein